MTVVAILGMHRSGTSCLAGSLEAWGLPLGEVKTSSKYNKLGNRENPDIFRLHEAVLADNGGSWQNPLPVTEWRTERLDALEAIIKNYPAGYWGFKDPRTLFLLDGWYSIIPRSRFQYVATFRHPMAVARSLNFRNGISIDQGLVLWRCYNQRLLSLMEDREIHLINFDITSLMYSERIAAICQYLGLDLEEPEVVFRDSTLISNHQTDNEAKLGSRVVQIYEKLLNHAQ
ncbi:MAG: sulfotransferase family protein [Gammaproteobacteria bacterium]|nr:sulfotransferase family protein [Gammaproteobacteria bacterium]